MIEKLIETEHVKCAIARVAADSRAAARAGCAELLETMAPAGVDPHDHVSKSHCGRWIAVAVSPDHEVGVDIEISKARRRLAKVAAWLDLDGTSQSTFHAHWTLREAIAKCVGGSVLVPESVEPALAAAMSRRDEWLTAGEYSALCGRHADDLYYALVLKKPDPDEALRCA